MNKVYSLHDAVAKFVENGDVLAIGGFTTNRKPYAVVSEILLHRQLRLHQRSPPFPRFH